jgi:PAS domain S-box-containing protein
LLLEHLKMKDENKNKARLLKELSTLRRLRQSLKDRTEALRESEARFRTLFENGPEAMVVLDTDIGKFVEANPKALQLFGFAREDFIGLGPLDISSPLQPDGRGSKDAVQEKIQELLSEKPKPFEWAHKKTSGEEILCEIRPAKLPSADQNLFCGIAIDITECRRMENELNQLKRIVESTSNPIGLVDWNFIYRFVNEPYCQALKKSANEIIGHPVPELPGRNVFETVMERQYNRCFAGENVDYQEWFDLPGWGRRYLGVRYYPFRKADVRVAAVVTNVHSAIIPLLL